MGMNISWYNAIFTGKKKNESFSSKNRNLCATVEKHIFLSQVGNSLACRFYRTFLGRKRDPFPRETH